jgi:hypothetical protein
MPLTHTGGKRRGELNRPISSVPQGILSLSGAGSKVQFAQRRTRTPCTGTPESLTLCVTTVPRDERSAGRTVAAIVVVTFRFKLACKMVP